MITTIIIIIIIIVAIIITTIIIIRQPSPIKPQPAFIVDFQSSVIMCRPFRSQEIGKQRPSPLTLTRDEGNPQNYATRQRSAYGT